MPEFEIKFEANRLHEIGRPIDTFYEIVMAGFAHAAVMKLYDRYEHINVLKIQEVGNEWRN